VSIDYIADLEFELADSQKFSKVWKQSAKLHREFHNFYLKEYLKFTQQFEAEE
jgi:hypothetical protein